MFGLPNTPLKAGALLLASVFYTAVGVMHFTHVDFFLRSIPPYLPYPLALVWLSGVFEILGGLGLLVPQTRRFASWGLIALLFAVYPANIHMWLNPELFSDLGSPTALTLRMPFQCLFIIWAWWIGRPD
jgi:uncharacterized membrane protein